MKKFCISLSFIIFHFSFSAAQTYTLQQLQQKAVENNRTLKNARLNVESAKEDKAKAYTHFFPQVSANAVGFQGFEDLVQGSMPAGENEMPISLVKKGFVGSMMAIQPLFQGGQIINGNKLATLQQEVNQLQLQMTEKDVELQVAKYYWQLVSLQSNIATLDSVTVQLDEVHRLTKNYVDAGVITHNDLLRVELKQQEIASNRLELENGISIVKMLLAQTAGIAEGDCDIEAPSLAPCPLPLTYLKDKDESVQNREELALSQKNEEAQRLNVKMERGKLLPSLAVGVNGFYYTIDSHDNTNGIVFATLSVPISDWWGGSHAIKKAKLQRLQAENDRMEAQEKLAIDIQSAWNNLEEAYKQIDIAKASVESAKENLRMQRIFYSAGTTTMTDLLDAITLYTQAQSQMATACATYQMRVAEYRRKTS
ncbi:MAG: TolC family protein [Bacteroidaceae bacterium]|nr:TolC family protein [Bacteroidaceae bacterium]